MATPARHDRSRVSFGAYESSSESDAPSDLCAEAELSFRRRRDTSAAFRTTDTTGIDEQWRITAKDVGALRERTGAGMMDCKKALEETNGDMDKAVEYLRSKGTAKAEKRAGRAASKEGMVANYIHHNGKIAVLVELNCETDFVARTDDFQQLGKYLAEHIAAAAPIAVDKDAVPAEMVESERRIFVEQVKARASRST